MKGVSEIISIVLIIIIAIGLASTAYTWGLPLIQKTQGKASVDQVSAAFDPTNAGSLTSQIYNIFSSSGQSQFTLSTNGIWAVKADDGTQDSNYIQFTFFNLVSPVTADSKWHTSTGSCPPSSGVLGTDNFYLVCSWANPYLNGYNISYKVYYRELDSIPPGTGQKISIIPTSSITSTGTSLLISRGTIYQTVVNGITLTVTPINILLQ